MMSFVWFRGRSQTIRLNCDRIRDHLTRRRKGLVARFGGADPFPQLHPLFLQPQSSPPIVRFDVLSSLSLIDIKPYPKRIQEASYPSPQWTMSPTVEALGGRTVATEPRDYLETLRGALPSLYRLLGSG